MHSQGQIPTEAFNTYHAEPYERLQQIENTLKELEEEVLVLTKRLGDNVVGGIGGGLVGSLGGSSSSLNQAKEIYSKWDSFDHDKKRQIIEAVVEAIIIEEEDIRFKMKRIMPSSHYSKRVNNGDQTYPNYSILHQSKVLDKK